MDQLLRDLAVEARHADVETRRQEESSVGQVQVDLGVDLRDNLIHAAHGEQARSA